MCIRDRHQCVNRGATAFFHVGDHQVLVAGHAEFASVHLGDFAQAGEVLRIGPVGDSPGRQVECQVPVPVFTLHPTRAVTVVVESESACRGKGKPGTAFNFAHDLFQAVVVDGVLEARAVSYTHLDV